MVRFVVLLFSFVACAQSCSEGVGESEGNVKFNPSEFAKFYQKPTWSGSISFMGQEFYGFNMPEEMSQGIKTMISSWADEAIAAMESIPAGTFNFKFNLAPKEDFMTLDISGMPGACTGELPGL